MAGEKHDPDRESPEERRDWETIQDNGAGDVTQRLKIVGGWLYRTVTSGNPAIVFVPGA
jgi:hypothetical protein